jgi:hypothetical protein
MSTDQRTIQADTMQNESEERLILALVTTGGFTHAGRDFNIRLLAQNQTLTSCGSQFQLLF